MKDFNSGGGWKVDSIGRRKIKGRKIYLDKLAIWWLNINHDTAIFTRCRFGIS